MTHEPPHSTDHWHLPKSRRRIPSTLGFDVVVIDGPPEPHYSRLEIRFTLDGELQERSHTFTVPFEGGHRLEIPVLSEAEDVEIRWREPGS